MSHKLFYGVLATGLITLSGCQSESHSDENFGHFKGDLTTKWLPDGRRMMLKRSFAYIAPDGKRWDAPRRSVVDGASIPKWAWSLIGSPFVGKYRNASVVHDVACQEKKELWPEVHEMFYNACRCGGVGENMAKTMYYAVYFGCPRWERKAVGEGKPVFEVRPPPIEHLSEKQLKKIRKYIETNNPSLEELRTLKPDSPELRP